CERCELPDLEPLTITDLKRQFEDSFGKGAVALKADPEKEMVKVTVTTPDGELNGAIKVHPVGEVEEEQEVKPKFLPLPVCLPADPELVWVLARTENLSPDEACIMLNKVQDDFWASKAGQKLIRDRVDRSFPEFVARVPSKL